MKQSSTYILVALWLAAGGTGSADGPTAFWSSSPARPGESVMLLGDSLTGSTEFLAVRLPDDAADLEPPATGAVPIPALAADGRAAVLTLPDALHVGVYALRMRDARGAGITWLNLPDPWWIQGDEGGAATAGGWIRVFGTCLSLDKPPALRLRHDGGFVPLEIVRHSPWDVAARLPNSITAGPYEVLVHNGYGGNAAWRSAGQLAVMPPVAVGKATADVSPDAGDSPDDTAIQRALSKVARAGGGVVTLQQGFYDMQGVLTVPPNTVLRGPKGGGATLHWPDLDPLPEALMVVNDAAIEDLSIYCRAHRVVIDSAPTSTRFRMNRVRLRANGFFMQIQPGRSYRGRPAPAQLGDGIGVRVTGRNFQMADCDLWCSGQAIAIDPHAFAGRTRPVFGVIRGNRIAYGSQGHVFENVDRLIFEENELSGCGSAAGGNAITTYWNNFSRHIFYARNHTHDVYGVDRECPTLDGDGSAYLGTAASDGTRLTLMADPVFRDYAPQAHTDYRGAAVYVLSGAGAGQYRFVTAHRGREWIVDRPWDVALDETSMLSIVPFRGRNIFYDNRFEDTGPLQLYGSAADVIVAGNAASRSDGLFAWGLSQHGWGLHPVLRCQFLGNSLVGGGAGSRITPTGIVVTAGDESGRYAGPMALGVVIRGNTLDRGMSIRIDGTVNAVLVEDNVISDVDAGIHVGPKVTTAATSDNTFKNVRVEVSGDGARALRRK
jgi:hypothetical protein